MGRNGFSLVLAQFRCKLLFCPIFGSSMAAISSPRRLMLPFSRNAEMKSLVVKRSIKFAGHKTSVSLEDAFWTALKEIAGGRDVTLSALIEMIDHNRQNANLSSAIRLFVLGSYQDQISNHQGRPPEQKVA
jgi:predicted DNA-binding ribbon-helix-helix protein